MRAEPYARLPVSVNAPCDIPPNTRAPCILNKPRPQRTGGLNQEIKNHVYRFLDSLLPWAGTPASAVRLSPRAAGSTSALATPPGVASLTNNSASDSAPLPSFDPSHIQQVCRGAPTHRSVAIRTAQLWLLNKSPGHGSWSVSHADEL